MCMAKEMGVRGGGGGGQEAINAAMGTTKMQDLLSEP